MSIAAIFGKRLRSLRNARGISQEHLAELAELTPSYVSKLERARGKAVSFDALEALSSALGVSPAELFEAPRRSRRPAALDRLEDLLRGQRASEVELVYQVAQRICTYASAGPRTPRRGSKS